MEFLKVFYNPKMSVDSGGVSPSASKPELVVQDWLDSGIGVQIENFRPIEQTDLLVTHSLKYINGIFDGSILNGHGNTSPEVAESTLWTIGSMVNAAIYAAGNCTVACSPTSGFHHAKYNESGPFCTFNGLIVAALAVVRLQGLKHRVGILDFDMHYGDGTDDILNRMRDCNGEVCWASHVSGIRDDSILDREYLTDLILGMDAKLILYQAGADQHIDDPLGGLFTTEELEARDRMVFEICRANGIAVAWNLAGGYQRDEEGGIRPVLDIHRNTAKACIDVYSGNESGQLIENSV